MNERYCSREEKDTPSQREYKQDIDGVLKTSREIELSNEDRRKIEAIRKKIPDIKAALEEKLWKLSLAEEVVKDIIKRKYIVIGKTFRDTIAHGTAESFKIDNDRVIVTAWHLVGFSQDTTGTFEWDIVLLYDLEGNEYTVQSSYTSRKNDIGFIFLNEAWNSSYYDLDKDFLEGNLTVDTGIYSALEGDITQEEKQYTGMLYNFILKEKTKTPENATIANNSVELGDSGSVIIDENSNPYCIVQNSIPNLLIIDGTVCESMQGVRKAFRDYKLLQLEQDCREIK